MAVPDPTPTSPVTRSEPADRTAAEVPAAPPLDVDVLVVGAGIAGIDVACRLSRHCPDVVWAVLEARDAVGGVNLDNEAVDLMRFQQAYSASSRVIQVARDTFQSILEIR